MNGFIRHDSLNWNKLKKQKVKASCSEFIPYMSNCAIPSRVAPQQSSSPLYATVESKMKDITIFTKSSFPHLVGLLGKTCQLKS